MGVNTKKLIQKYNLKLTKSLGQNFLIDDNIVKRIVDVAEITEKDLVIEIGPGVGSMTVELAKRAGKVVAVEIDKRLIPALEDNLGEFSNVDIINKDIMDVNINEFRGESGNVKVVANLPYYITTPIIMKLLEENNDNIDIMVFMVQKEVAQRMVASPGKKDYGALSVAVQYYTKPEKAFDVPPHCFVPQPEVDSTVIKLKVNETPPVKLMDKDYFFTVVKAAFGQRRKTLVHPCRKNRESAKRPKSHACRRHHNRSDASYTARHSQFKLSSQSAELFFHKARSLYFTWLRHS